MAARRIDVSSITSGSGLTFPYDYRPLGPDPHRRPRLLAHLGQGTRLTSLPGGPNRPPAVGRSDRDLAGRDGAARRPSDNARRGFSAAPPHGRGRAAIGGWHAEVPLAPRRRRGHRIGIDPERQPAD